VPVFEDVDSHRASATIAGALTRGGGWLDGEEVAELLACYGMAMPPWRITAGTAEAVEQAARELPGKVAIKAIAPGLLHKTDAGGVETGVTNRGAASAARRIEAAVGRAGHEVESFFVQSMASPGVEMLVGTVVDPTFGPVVVCGGGGTAAEVIGDVAVRVTPVTDRDAHEMTTSLRTYPLLSGYRGSPPVDVEALEEVVLRLGALVEAHPEVVEVDLNPVIVSADGASVVDARMRVEPPPPRPPWPSLGR
jgi:acyl-CoA synthetase (NDP forming)